jgi:uncharacterized protein YyaL (SSP411 family)
VAFRIHELTGQELWRTRGADLVRAFAGRAGELGLFAATYLLAVDWQLNPATHLVIVGETHDETARAMHEEALRGFVPRRVVQLLTPSQLNGRGLPPALSGMLEAGRAPRAYACAGTSCSPPVSDLAAWRGTLESLRSVVA